MPLQTSGAISLQNLQDEFGGSHPIQLTEYGGLRQSGTGSTISLSDYYGGTNSPVVTQGTLQQQYSTIYGFNLDNSVGSVSPSAWYNSSQQGRTIKEIARINSSAGLFFHFELSYSAAIPANDFTSIQFTANGTLTTLTSAESYTSTTQGGFGRRWSWSLSNGLDTTEVANIAAEFDGSGTVTITVNQ